jgi:tRNA nucleotidyltransferase/poly(A) polymerase
VNDAATALRGPLAAVPEPAWVVGGGLRDALIGRPVLDLDLAVQGDAGVAARALATAHGATRFRLSAAFGAWRVQGGRLAAPVDLTPLQGGSLAEDLDRRDFTVNAMALPVRGPAEVVDRHGGLGDLDAGRLRLVRPSALADDPVRLLRLPRLARQLGFAVDASAAERARADARLLDDAAGERVAEELRRMLRQPEPWRGIDLLEELGVLGAVVPELDPARGMEQSPYHHKDVLAHVLETVRHTAELAADPEPVFRSLAPRVAARLAEPLADDLTRGQALVLAALLHDMGKPATRATTPDGRITFMGHDRVGMAQAEAWCGRMRTSSRLREFLALSVRHHLTLGFMVHRTPLSLRQMDRYLRATEPAEVEIMALSVADRLATRGPRTSEHAVRRHLVLAREMMAAHFSILDRGPLRPPMDGAALAEALGRAPGPWLGDLLTALREEQLVGAVQTPKDVLRFSKEWMQSVET